MRQNSLILLLFCLGAGNPSLGHSETLAANDSPPSIARILPSTIDACSFQEEKNIVVLGEFPTGTRILIDGAEVPATKMSAEEIIVELPALKGGLHRVEAVARGNRKSLPQALSIDTAPQITDVLTGEDQVTAYEVIVRGINFLFESTLVVNGAALRPARSKDPNAGSPPVGGKDYVRYEDCSTLVYIRHPVTREPEPVSLQVVNPGGEQSPKYEVTIP